LQRFCAVAFGSNNVANGGAAIAIGDSSSANGTATIAIGNFVQATATSAVAIGDTSRATATTATAIWATANAGFAGSTALGNGATTTRANQVVIGGTGSSVTVGDIAASTAAQTGPTDIMTVDASSTVGRDTTLRSSITALSGAAARLTAVEGVNATHNTAIAAIQTLNTTQDNRLSTIEVLNANQQSQIDTLQSQLAGLNGGFKQSNGGIAAAMALSGMMVAPDSDVSMSFNLSTYRGEQGFSAGIVGRVAPKVYISGGFAGSSVKGSTGGRFE
jgi:trimeric autotransporter adhesin